LVSLTDVGEIGPKCIYSLLWLLYTSARSNERTALGYSLKLCSHWVHPEAQPLTDIEII